LENGEHAAHYFSASSKEEKDEWLAILTNYCRCCDFCDSVPHSPFQRFQGANDTLRKILTVSITVRSAREIPTVDIIRGKCDPYCVIQLNEIDMARTFTKWHTSQPLWEENFVFECVPFPIRPPMWRLFSPPPFTFPK